MKSDPLGDRVKHLERIEAGRSFPEDAPVVIRIDGRRFSRFTRGFRKPFDPALSGAMRETCRFLVQETQARIGYVQSDEITLILQRRHDLDALPFSGRSQKLASICASLATACFMRTLHATHAEKVFGELPTFDARAWPVPDRQAAAEALVWRIRDARKNGISAACRVVARPSEMQGLDGRAMIALMAERGIRFERDIAARDRLGVLFRREVRHERIDDATWERIPERSRPPCREVSRRAVVAVPVQGFLDAGCAPEWIFDEPDGAA